MEARRIGSLYVVFLVVVLLAGQCTASFDDCYKGCFLSCAISPDNAVFTCAVRCLKDCIFNFASPNHHSCSMGCASSSCSHISARDNPREEEVASHMQQEILALSWSLVLLLLLVMWFTDVIYLDIGRIKSLTSS